MIGISKKEIELISWLEFNKKYFFTSYEVDKFTKNKTQRYNLIKNLLKKKRIVKLNRFKYYLIPIKAKSGSWAEDDFILADEMMNGEDYFIGGWAAANYYHLTEQIPMRTDIYTTKRQGSVRILSSRFIFHRTTKKRIEKAVTQIINGHTFRIIPKKEAKRWMKLRE